MPGLEHPTVVEAHQHAWQEHVWYAGAIASGHIRRIDDAAIQADEAARA